MRRIADHDPSEAKTDAKDAVVIANAARASNRIRWLLTQYHFSLERVLGPRLERQAVTWLLDR